VYRPQRNPKGAGLTNIARLRGALPGTVPRIPAVSESLKTQRVREKPIAQDYCLAQKT